MKKLLVCLMMCIAVSFVTIKIEGVSVPEKYTVDIPEYAGADVFVLTVGDETESTYIIMKDSKVLKIEVLTEEQIDELLKEPSSYEREI